MKKLAWTICLLFGTVLSAQAQVPSLQKQGKKTCLMVDGKPYVMYAGELHNSTASSIDYMNREKTFENLAAMGLNTVLATISWEQFEPTEGTYDYTLVNDLLNRAERNHMKLCLLWFGTFKNPFMTYAPSWVKKNPKRFPRAVDAQGKELEMISVTEEAIQQADSKAYAQLMRYLSEKDTHHTVLMMQIENEPGLRGTPRDFSASAQKAWKAQVPADLIAYLKANKNSLQPDVAQAWKENGCRTQGNWEEVFGKSITQKDESGKIVNLTEHLFTAYNYAHFVNLVAAAGKQVYALPTFINASVFGMNTRGNSLGNGCSIPEFLDIYKAAAPQIDVLTPNSYMQQLDYIGQAFSYKGNPILIPESTLVGARALYIIGEYHALGFSPFGIDATEEERRNPGLKAEQQKLKQVYETLQNMGDLLTSRLGTDELRGSYLYTGHDKDTLTIGNYQFVFGPKKGFDIGALMAPAGGGFKEKKEPEKIEQGAALVLQVGADEFYVVGYGYNADITLKSGVKARYTGIDQITEGRFENGKFIPGRILNGDERNVYADYSGLQVLNVKMYHY